MPNYFNVILADTDYSTLRASANEVGIRLQRLAVSDTGIDLVLTYDQFVMLEHALVGNSDLARARARRHAEPQTSITDPALRRIMGVPMTRRDGLYLITPEETE